MQNKLAIVIPAYKTDFFEQTISSIANQSNSNFTLYIGDDCSPHSLFDIAEKYSKRINIVYKRFSTNLGKTNLVAQWERCIKLIESEEWIWLFSDDDLMETYCVEKFYYALNETEGKYDLYRFNTKRINQLNEELESVTMHPLVESGSDFLNRKLGRKTNSYAVEYIFKRAEYTRKGGFVKFPAAWASDDATWATIGNEKGIYTIQGALVSWRYSGHNLSSIHNPELAKLKKDAVIKFSNWIVENYGYRVSQELLFDWAIFQYSLLKKSGKWAAFAFYLRLTIFTRISKRLIAKTILKRINSKLVTLSLRLR